jgi:hypothetical protein
MMNKRFIVSVLWILGFSLPASAAVSVTTVGAFPTMCVVSGATVNQSTNIVISEAFNNDFNQNLGGYYDFAIVPATGYEFIPNVGNVNSSGDFDDAYTHILVFRNYIRINLRSPNSGNVQDEMDVITISGLQMKALSGAAASGTLVFSTGYLPCNPGIENLGTFANYSSSNPSAPTVTNQTRCGSGNVVFTPSGATSYNLYTASTGGSAVATGSTLTYSVSSSGLYFVSAITGGCESSTRTPVQAIVNAPPTVTANPSNQFPCDGGIANFSISATGTNVNYQWRVSIGGGPYNNVSGSEYIGATSANLSISPVTAGMDGYAYQCFVSGTGCPTVNSAAAIIDIPTSASITVQPSNTSICAASSGSISITTSNQLSYQWQEDPGTGIYSDLSNDATYSNVTSSNLSINAVIGMNGYRYRCAVGSACNSPLYSNPAILTVRESRTVTTQPSNKTICEGEFTTFNFAATGTVTAYQWQQFSGATWNNITDGGIFWGTTTPTLFVVAPTTAENGTQFRCNYTGGCTGTTISSNAGTLTVNGFPAISSQPPNRTVCLNATNTTFGVTASNATAYQWQVNSGSGWSDLSNGAPYSGVTSATLTIASLTIAMDGHSYRCRVTGACSPPTLSEIGVLNITQATPDFTGLNAQYCINGDSTKLIGTPSGGVFTISGGGPGISFVSGDYWFNPRAVGSTGNKNIVYTYSPGCTFTSTKSTTIINKPTVNFVGLSPGYSSTATLVALNASGVPSGGGYSFAGPSVTGTVFNPAAAGQGTHVLYAYYVDPNGCRDTVSSSVEVVPQSGSILGLETSYCTNSPRDTIYGIKGANGVPGSGVWGYSGNITIVSFLGDSAIVLQFLSSGPFDLFYEFASNNCAPGSCLTYFQTHASSFTTSPPVASFNSNKFFCLSDAPYTLTGVPAGGVFSGPGVTLNAGVYRFDPSLFPNGTSGNQFISYSYVNSTNGCRSIPDPLTDWMFIYPTPTEPIIDSVAYIKRVKTYCQGDVAQPWVTKPVGGTNFYWYSDAALTSLVGIGGSFTPLVSTSIVATTSYYVRGFNGSCFGPVTQVTMIVNPKGFVTAGTDKLICEGTSTVNISTGTSITGAASTGIWSRVGGGGSFSTTAFGGTVTYSPNAADILAGNAYLVLTTNDPDGTGPCNAEKDTVLVRINPRAVVYAGATQTICQSNSTIVVSTGTSISGGTATGIWSRDGAVGTFLNGTSYSHIIQNTITYTIDAADIAAGFVNLVLTTSDPDGIGPCSTEDDTVRININAQAIVSTGPNQVVCANATPALTATNLTATIGGAGSSFTWIGGAGTFSVASGSGTNANTVYTPNASELAGAAITFTLISNDPDGAGPCTAAMNTTKLTINQRATVNAPNDTIICAGLTTSASQLAITASAGNGAYSYTWSGGTGLFIPISGLAPNASTVYQPSAAELVNSTPFRLYITTNDPDDFGPCVAAKDSMLVTINRRAIVNAGVDKTICSGVPSVAINTGANISGGTTSGTWYKVENAGTFSPNNLFGSAPTYIPITSDTTNGGIHLVLESLDPDGSGPCSIVRDTLFIAVGKGALVEAGIAQTVCAGATGAQTPVNLSAAFISGSSTSATWSGGAGTFSPVSNIFVGSTNVSYIPDASELVSGTYKLYLTSNDPDGAGPCLAAKDSVLITINDRTIVNAGPDKTVCEGTPTVAIMIGASISGGTTLGSWTKIESGGSFSPDAQITSNPLYNMVVSDTTNGGIHFVLSSVDPDGSGPCLITRDTVFVKVNKAAYVDASAAQTVCAGSSGALTPVNLSSAAITGSATSAIWSGGNGSFSPAVIIAGSNTVNYFPDISELFPGGPIKLYLTTNDPDGAAGPCVPAKDSVVITVNPKAVVNAGLDHIVCENTGNVIIFTNTSITGGTNGGYWERSGGGGTFVADNSYSSGTRYQLDASDVSAGFVDVVLVSNDPDGSGPCLPETDTTRINIRYLPLVNAGTDSVVCAGDTTINTFIYLSDATISGSTFTGSWTGGAGSFFPSPVTVNARYIPHTTELISGIPIALTLRSSDPPGPCGFVEDTKTVTINPRVFVDAGSDQSVCSSGPTLALNGSVVKSQVNAPGIWTTPRGAFANANSPTTNFTVDPLDRPLVGAAPVKLTLKLTGTDPDGSGPCTSEADSMVLTVYGLPDVDISNLDPGYCQKPGDVFKLTGTPLDGATGSGFYMDPSTVNNFLGGGNAAGLSFIPASFSPGLHTLRFSYIHPATGCINNKDRVVSLKPYPKPGFIAMDSCATRTVNIVDTTTVNVGVIDQFLWEYGEDNNSNLYFTQTNPTYVYKDPGNYNLRVTYTTDSGCVNSFSKLLSIGSIPKTDFRWTGVCPADATNFFDLSGFDPSKVQSYAWNFGDSPPGTSALQNPTYDYTTVGSYNVSFTITSTHQCDSVITKKVNILPFAAPTSTSPYVEDFNADDGNWAISGKNPSWEYGLPLAKQSISHPNNVWITKQSGVYNVDEKSYLDGPCFNFSNLDRPMVSLKLWSATQQQIAGATIEASTNGGTTWQRIGGIGEGINWYDFPNVIGNPGNQSISQGAQAWTGQYGGWKVAKIGLPQYSFQPNVRIRIAFGSGLDSLGLADGFALDSVHVGNKTKLVLLEHFTNNNVTAANDAIQYIDLIRERRPKDVAVITNHTSFPSADPYSAFNFSDPGSRVLYYGVPSVPRTVLDGNYYNNNIYTAGTADTRLDTIDIDTRSLGTAIFDLSINSLVSSGQVNVGAKLRYKNSAVLTNGIVLQVAVVEDSASAVNSQNSVLRKMMPNAAGTLISPNRWAADSTISIYNTYTHNLPGSAKLNVVAFVQDASTKEIYQAAFARGSQSVGDDIIDGTLDKHISDWNVDVYPNPASDAATVFFGGSSRQKLTWTLLDEVGKIVDQGSVSAGMEGFEINTSNHASGMYLLKIQDELGGITCKKIVVAQ